MYKGASRKSGLVGDWLRRKREGGDVYINGMIDGC